MNRTSRNDCRIAQRNTVLGALTGIVITLFAAGCATLSTQVPPDTIATTIITDPAANSGISANDFNILGRISIQDKDQSFSGSFRWRHSSKIDEILLFTPLGQAIAEITKDSDGVRLITSKLEAFYAENVEHLTEEVLGWRLPLSGLQYWIQGAHSPITSAEKDLGQTNQLIAIRQDGWNIHYTRFTAEKSHPNPMPKLFHLFYENDRLKIRVIVDDWNAEY